MSDLTERYQTGNRLLRKKKTAFRVSGCLEGVGEEGEREVFARGIRSCADASAAALKFLNPLGLKVLVSFSFFPPGATRGRLRCSESVSRLSGHSLAVGVNIC